MTQVYEISIEIKNEFGLHMRPAMRFVDVANQFDSEISVSNGDQSVDGKSIMQMSMLAAQRGTLLTVRAQGEDAQTAIEALRELVEERMFEEGPDSE